ncbi:PREDICTED: zinc finger protein CONSTANS-LIKE 4-like [Camelina sativa]|uniref:Zinc finger protein CONSTANS-LIKE 4-like n=1 Tax=Camelina sativa TaxID=90675 RepID=A0ABM0UBA8_CAMSA|nr:PREDICTED: zinc finger protein CONSTANS-LIKE 4-like [Camelina sativa]
MMGKKCDLCSGVAKMYCESDEASLCWDCDGKVHGANFLVAKHTRCLLCSACQSLTSWKASGLRLGPTFSVCDSCLALKNAAGGGGAGRNRISSSENQNEEVNSFDRIRDDDAESYDDDDDEDEEYSDDDEDEGDVDDDEEAENQVVPWSAAAAQSPPVVCSSSSSDGGLVTKRTRTMENSDLLCSDDEIGSSSAVQESRPLKRSSRDKEPMVNSIVRMNSADTSASSSSSSLIFAIGKSRRDLSR